MPTSHRLACFRDDVVFLIYLYQRWYTRRHHTLAENTQRYLLTPRPCAVPLGCILWTRQESMSMESLMMRNPRGSLTRTRWSEIWGLFLICSLFWWTKEATGVKLLLLVFFFFVFFYLDQSHLRDDGFAPFFFFLFPLIMLNTVTSCLPFNLPIIDLKNQIPSGYIRMFHTIFIVKILNAALGFSF